MRLQLLEALGGQAGTFDTSLESLNLHRSCLLPGLPKGREHIRVVILFPERELIKFRWIRLAIDFEIRNDAIDLVGSSRWKIKSANRTQDDDIILEPLPRLGVLNGPLSVSSVPHEGGTLMILKGPGNQLRGA